MSATYTVVRAEKKKDLPDAKFGPAQVIALRLQNGAGEVDAEWFTKATTTLPAPGSKLEGDLEDSEYGKKFKKAQSSGGFGGGGGMSPERQAAIQRQHSQEMGLRALAILAGSAPIPLSDDAFKERVKEWTDWFDADVGGGAGPIAAAPTGVTSPAADVSAGTITEKQLAFLMRLVREKGAEHADALTIEGWAKATLSTGREGSASRAIDGLQENPAETLPRLLSAAQAWEAKQPAGPPPDTTDLPDPDLSDDTEIVF